MHVGFFFLSRRCSDHERTGLHCPAFNENLPELQARVLQQDSKDWFLGEGVEFSGHLLNGCAGW